ncbi:aftiphilin [Musca autumnalis]|uniref:aftiphilin n=1 Tax=Musca autumnalis TaxID=221902 RepID=UPI003CEA5A41
MNVPPIPPLLCSTPPPIDFGDDDDDVLRGDDVDVDEEFGDFSGGDIKIDEPLPSSRPPSVTDLPPVSIYDGFLPQDDPLSDPVPTSNDTLKKTQQPSPIVEAFNYSIIEQQAKEVNEGISQNFTNGGSEKENLDIANENQTGKQSEMILECPKDSLFENNCQIIKEEEKTTEEESPQQSTDNIEIPFSNDDAISSETNQPPPVPKLEINIKPTISPLTNIVSIEDLEDDLSDDELYSPRTPKNLVDADATSNDYFKIHDIQQNNNASDADAKDSSADMDITKKSPDSFVFASFNEPPPIDDLPPLDANDDNVDDFGDFADFQDFSSNTTTAIPSTLNTETAAPIPSVPVDECKSENTSNDYDDEFHDFIQHSHSGSHTKGESDSLPCVETNRKDVVCTSDNDDFDDFTSANVITPDFCSGNIEKTEGETELYSEGKSDQNEDDNFGNFNEMPIDHEQRSNLENEKGNMVCIEPNNEFSPSQCDENDDYGDFADFSSQPPANTTSQSIDKTEQKPQADVKSDKEHVVEDDEDDDFGDFNTAEPITSQVAIDTKPTSQISSCNTHPVTLQTPKNLNERISKILELMFSSTAFPLSTTPPNEKDTELKKQKIQDIPFTSIDAAKALEYQWLNSETRHAFIKSLGIDSRNILYGENWNPSLPRFAANLSFNPLKPMKPISSYSGTESISTPSCPKSIETVPVSNSDVNKTVNDHNLADIKRDTAELDWKISSAEQRKEALDNNPAVQMTSNTSPTAQVEVATSLPYVATEPPETLTIFDNPLDIDTDKFSKTPPISEMESVNSLSSPIPSLSALEIDIPPVAAAPIVNTFKQLDLNEPANTEDILEVVTSTTFSGSFKETHIYTPPKTMDNSSSTPSSTSTTSPAKANSIDFDYEKAAMGVIIDETVVKKEYRDIEYNSPFTRESLTRTPSLKTEFMEPSNMLPNQTTASTTSNSGSAEEDFNDEFTEFQSVPSVPITLPTVPIDSAVNSKLSNNNQSNRATSEISKVSNCGMILSPAILIPQAISMESNKPKIEWGDSTASINPEELARIEELFPEPAKMLKSNNTTSSSQKSTPTHQSSAPTTISAAVANREFEGTNNGGDDDDWSDFISVPVVATNNNNNVTKTPLTNNNASTKSRTNSPFKQRSPVNSYKIPNYNNSPNDDEWSDFVSSAPSPATTQPAEIASNIQGPPPAQRVPQFNSGAWQNANFYNNPLSLYHKGPLNLHSNSQQSPKNYLNNNNYNQFQSANIAGHQQQIHVMQNFSTAPVPNPTADRLPSSTTKTPNQFQVGSSVKVAPSIALIPDLGFVAPAIPTHTSFINSLPKPSINTKK